MWRPSLLAAAQTDQIDAIRSFALSTPMSTPRARMVSPISLQRCRTTYYCSAACQEVQDWTQRKTILPTADSAWSPKPMKPETKHTTQETAFHREVALWPIPGLARHHLEKLRSFVRDVVLRCTRIGVLVVFNLPTKLVS